MYTRRLTSLAALEFMAVPGGMAFVLFIAAFLLTVKAEAQAEGKLEDPAMEILTVTASRQAVPINQLAGNTSVINKEALELVAPVHIQEVMSRVPGANLARGNGQEYLPALRSPVLTGAGGCGSVLSTVDGVPLRAAGFCNINELFESPSEFAQRIEVIRGPGTALYGSNAMHGVINILTPTVAAEGGQVSVEAGPHDYSRLKLNHNVHMDAHRLRADVLLGHDGGYRDDSGFDQQKLLLRHEYDNDLLSLTTSFSLTNLNQETAGYVTGTDAYKDDQLQDSNPNPEAYRDASALRFASRIRYAVTDTAHWLLTPYIRIADMEFMQHFLPGDPVEENQQKSLGIQSAYFLALYNNLDVITGLDVEYSQGSLEQTQASPTQGSAFLQATIPQGKHYDYRVDAFVLAPFAQFNWQPTEQLLLTAGLRFEAMEYRYDNRMLDGRTADDGTPCGFGGCRYSRPEDSRDRFENLSPKLGVLYQISPSQQIYLNLSQGFRAPQATELYRLQREQQVADLDSESLNSFELGWREEAARWHYEIAAFAMEKKHIIFRDSDFFNVSDGKSTHAGVEVALGIAFSQHWQLGIAASYAEHHYDDTRLLNGIDIDGNRIDSAPRWLGNTHLSWRPTSSMIVELEWLHQGAYYTDPENLHEYEGHDVFNLRSRWQLTGDITLMARISNLTDRDYAERADYSSFSGDRYFPGEPRGFYLGVELGY